MTIREQLKKDIDELNDDYLEALHKIIVALKANSKASKEKSYPFHENPLKGSIIFEGDILSPIDETWNADQ